MFDPEWVGAMLSAKLRDLTLGDFQELPPWRTLVPQVADEIARFTADHLVAVQTVLVESIWRELRSGFDRLGLPVFHVLLDIEELALRERIAADEVEANAAEWRLRHIGQFVSARRWMTAAADLVVDVSSQAPSDAASAIGDAVRALL